MKYTYYKVYRMYSRHSITFASNFWGEYTYLCNVVEGSQLTHFTVIEVSIYVNVEWKHATFQFCGKVYAITLHPKYTPSRKDLHYSKIIFPPIFNGIFASRNGKNLEWKKQILRLKSEMQNCWRYVLVESFNIKLDVSILIFRFR